MKFRMDREKLFVAVFLQYYNINEILCILLGMLWKFNMNVEINTTRIFSPCVKIFLADIKSPAPAVENVKLISLYEVSAEKNRCSEH